MSTPTAPASTDKLKDEINWQLQNCRKHLKKHDAARIGSFEAGMHNGMAISCWFAAQRLLDCMGISQYSLEGIAILGKDWDQPGPGFQKEAA